MPVPKVFISYSHDTPQHSKRVLELAWALRDNGVDVELDQFHNEEIIDWPRWCGEQISREHSDFVLCVCTAEYRRRIEGHVPPEKGKGVYWEGSLLDDEIYDDKGNCRIVAVLIDDELDTSIPRFLRGWTHCRLSQFTLSDTGYEHLLRILTKQSKVEKNPLGNSPVLPTSRAPDRTSALVQTDFHADISRIDKYAPEELIGREAEIKLLNDAWEQAVRGGAKRPHILTFVALGGEGKTSLVAKWGAEMAYQGWPKCEAAFAWSFYSQGTREHGAASSDLFLKDALVFFGDAETAASAKSAYEKGRRLARLIGERWALLILDGLEPLQFAPTSPTAGELNDQGLAVLLKALAANSRGLCVVTTRYSVPDLRAYWQTTAPEVKLTRLSRETGVKLLKKLGVKGTQEEFETLVEDVKGHALTLNLLGSYLSDAHAGDIRRRDLVTLEEANAEEQGGHAFHIMDAYSRAFESEGEKGKRALALLCLMGLFDRPATADCLHALWRGEAIAGLTDPLIGLSDAQRNLTLKRLEDAKLLMLNRAVGSSELVTLDAHPLLREYFARRVREQQPEAWRAAHRRLYEHLCATTKEGDKPTLEDLQPLYQAVAHGCQAGLHQEALHKVYEERILRGAGDDGFYSTDKLGAFGSDLGLIACYFEQPWSRVSSKLTEYEQAWLLYGAGFSLRALGRLSEALEPMRTGLAMRVKQEDWVNAAISAGNLSEFELALGDVDGAIADAEQSVKYADDSGDAFQPVSNRSTYADALHNAGRRAEAEAIFRSAEALQAKREPVQPLLYSWQGFQYCDLLLATVERAVWQLSEGLQPANLPGMLTGAAGAESPPGLAAEMATLLQACRGVSNRTEQTIRFKRAQNWLLDIALDHLTLGRAALYDAILEKSGIPGLESTINQAVDDLRDAGQKQNLPLGLLTLAWLRSIAGQHTGADSAQADLDEAWEIAERGPMKLFMADIHLHRARLFFRAPHYPWDKNSDGTSRGPQDDLAEARRLVESCGYWRRKEELEDAEKVILR